MINVKNNSKSRLAGNLENENFFYCLPGEGEIFPENDFFITIEEKNNEKKVIKRMIVDISQRQGDRFEIRNKSVESCVQDDTANPKTYTNNILNFVSGSEITLYFTAGNYEYLRDKNLEKQNNLSDLQDKQQARNNLDVYQKRDVYSKNEADSRFVNISGDEEIAGKKRFTSSISVGAGVIPSGKLNNGKSVALGDGDTGIRQDGEGVFQIFTNNEKVAEWRTNGARFSKTLYLENEQENNPNAATKKSYVDSEIDKRITKAINKANSRNARIDIWLFS